MKQILLLLWLCYSCVSCSYGSSAGTDASSQSAKDAISERYGPPVKYYSLNRVEVNVTCWKGRVPIDGYYLMLFEGPDGHFQTNKSMNSVTDVDRDLTITYENLRLSSIVKSSNGYADLISKLGQPDKSFPKKNGVGDEGQYDFENLSEYVTLIVKIDAAGSMRPMVARKEHMLNQAPASEE